MYILKKLFVISAMGMTMLHADPIEQAIRKIDHTGLRRMVHEADLLNSKKPAYLEQAKAVVEQTSTSKRPWLSWRAIARYTKGGFALGLGGFLAKSMYQSVAQQGAGYQDSNNFEMNQMPSAEQDSGVTQLPSGPDRKSCLLATATIALLTSYGLSEIYYGATGHDEKMKYYAALSMKECLERFAPPAADLR